MEVQFTLQTLHKTFPQVNCDELLPCFEQELARKSPRWIIDSGYLKIKTKESGIIELKLNYAQKKFLSLLNELLKKDTPPRIIVLKARQLGISTLIDAIIYAYTSQQEGINSLILADDVDGSNYLLDIIKLYQESMPEHLKPQEKKSNEKKLEFEGLHSQILIDTANNAKAGRKYTYRYAHLSEVAFFPKNKIDELMTGMSQSVPKHKNTLVVMESTANGIGDYFHEVWTKAVKGENGWTPLFIAWYDNPEYSLSANNFVLTGAEKKYKQDVLTYSKYELADNQMAWRRYVIETDFRGDSDKFKQEYPAYAEQAFLVSGRPRFDIDTLTKLNAEAKEPIRREGNWEIFKEPNIEHPYIIGVDVSEGLEIGDNSVAQIVDCITHEQVAKYRGKIEPEALGYEVVIWGKRYNYALLAVEVNNHGLTTLTIIKQENYPHIFYRKIYDKTADQWTEKIGWQTTGKTKPFLIDHLAIGLLEGLGVVSRGTIEELITFVVNENGTCSAVVGKLDDEVISLAIAHQAYIETSWSKIAIPEPIAERGSVAEMMQEDEIKKNDWRSKYNS